MTENVVDGARSQSAKTQWFVTDEGCLKESGGDSFQFVLSIQDTLALAELLERNMAFIRHHAALAREEGVG